MLDTPLHAEYRIAKPRDVAGRMDVRIRRLQAFVDKHAIPCRNATAGEKPAVRLDAHGNHDEVAFDDVAVGEHDSLDRLLSDEALHRHSGSNVNATRRTSVTSRSRSRIVAAASHPVKPPPTISRRRCLAALSRSTSASSTS